VNAADGRIAVTTRDAHHTNPAATPAPRADQAIRFDTERHHDASHSGHGNGLSPGADRRWLTIALTLIAAFMVAEVVVGAIAHSLALISDAAHMLTDAAAIILAIVAVKLAARPARGHYTFGLKRAGILSAQINGVSLLILGGWLAYEAVRRLINPPSVHGWLVVATALAGVAVNLAATWSLSRANRSSLNVRGAFQHILNDLYAFVATAIAGLIVVLTGFDEADAIASLVVVTLMAKAGFSLLRDSGRILLEAAPAELDPNVIGDALASVQGVTEVHDLHVWTITSGQPALSAHVLVAATEDCHRFRLELRHLLHQQFNINHTTVQVDHVGNEPAVFHAGGYTAHCDDAHGPAYTNSETPAQTTTQHQPAESPPAPSHCR
jgi:cobalt-zinc-cadmium efflux system protein